MSIYLYIYICVCVCLSVHVWLFEVCPSCPAAGAGSAAWPAVDAISWLSAAPSRDPCPGEDCMLEPNKPSTKPVSTWACMAMDAFWENLSSSNWLVLVHTQNRMQASTSGASSSGMPPPRLTMLRILASGHFRSTISLIESSSRFLPMVESLLRSIRTCASTALALPPDSTH